jgi:chromosome partitioning protein
LASRLRRTVSEIEALERGKMDLPSMQLLEWGRLLEHQASVKLPQKCVAAMVNHAGGVGKTTMTRELGHAFNQVGLRVLLIDADAQANLTDWLGVDSVKVTVDQTIAPVLLGQSLNLPRPLTIRDGLDLIPSTLDLCDVEDEIGVADFLRLREAITKLEGYDLVLIDAAPTVVGLGRIAAISADELIVPLTPTDKSVAGLQSIERRLSKWHDHNPELTIGALIVTRFDAGTNNDTAMLRIIQEFWSDRPLLGPIPKATIFDAAQLEGTPVAVLRPNLAEPIYRVADGLLERWGAQLDWAGGLQ